MYIPPRPKAKDDPYFALRLAMGATGSLLIGFIIESQLPILLPIVYIALQGTIRKAFDIKKALLNPLVLLIVTLLFYVLLSYIHVKPTISVLVVFWICVFGYFITLKTGNPVGMLLLILVVFMSVMGATSTQALIIVRDGFVEALVASMLMVPLLYWLLPTRATEALIDEFQPDLYGRPLERALLRAFVLMLLLGWLYTFLDQNSMILAIAAIFTLMFPCKEHQYEEARERSYASLIGGAFALLILVVIGYIGHLFVLLTLTMLTGLYLGNKMITGPNPPMVYQFALSVCLTLVVGSLGNQAPLQLTLLRILLTLAGTLGAVFLYAVLEGLFIKDLELNPKHNKNPHH